VLKHDTQWDYVQYYSYKGYVDNQYLQLTQPTDAPTDFPDPSITPTPVPPFEPYTAITIKDKVNYHHRMGEGYSNVYGVGQLPIGTTLTVLKEKGEWAQVQYGNYKPGWVKLDCIRRVD